MTANRLWTNVIVLALLGLVAFWVVQVYGVTNNHDFEIFYRAAERLRAGEDIYAESLAFKEALESGRFNLQDEDVQWPYGNPPLLAELIVPLTFLPYRVAATFWFALNVALLLGALAVILAAVGRLNWVGIAVSLVLLFAFYPAVVCLRLGQVEILMFALIAASFLALNYSKDAWAGAALGLATAVKFFPAGLLVFLVWKRKWKAALWGIGVAVVALGASIAIIGADSFATYTKVWSVYTGGAFSAFPLNQSLNGFFSRMFRPNVFWDTWHGIESPALATGLWLGSAAILGGILAWQTWKPSRPDTERFDLEFGAAVAVLLLAGPHSQAYTFIWLLLPMVVLACRAVCTVPWSWSSVTVLLVGYAAVGRQWLRLPPIPVRLVRSHIMFGALLLVLWMFYLLWRKVPSAPGIGGEQ